MLGKYDFLGFYFYFFFYFGLYFFTVSHVISLATPETEQVIVCLVCVVALFI